MRLIDNKKFVFSIAVLSILVLGGAGCGKEKKEEVNDVQPIVEEKKEMTLEEQLKTKEGEAMLKENNLDEALEAVEVLEELGVK